MTSVLHLSFNLHLQIVEVMVRLQSQPAACQLDVMLAYEFMESEEAASVLYPVNAVRNLARLQVRM